MPQSFLLKPPQAFDAGGVRTSTSTIMFNSIPTPRKPFCSQENTGMQQCCRHSIKKPQATERTAQVPAERAQACAHRPLWQPLEPHCRQCVATSGDRGTRLPASPPPPSFTPSFSAVAVARQAHLGANLTQSIRVAEDRATHPVCGIQMQASPFALRQLSSVTITERI